MKYFEELCRAMLWLAEQPNTVFLGQATKYGGTGMSNTLNGIDSSKLKELPVAESLQLGMSTGLAIAGYIPISIFPRWNFLVEAAGQMVSHLDKIRLMSEDGYKTGVIIRTGVGSEIPLWPSYQHVGNFTEAFKLLCPNILFEELKKPSDIFPVYEKAYARALEGKPSCIVEHADLYQMEESQPLD